MKPYPLQETSKLRSLIWSCLLLGCIVAVMATRNAVPISNTDLLREHADSSRNQVVIVPDEVLNFGTVWATSQFEWTLPLHNKSDSEVVIDSISTSCSCTVVAEAKSPIVISCGASHELHLKMDLRDTALPSASDRDFSVNVTAFTSTHGELHWTVVGKVRDAFIITGQQVL